MFMINPFAINPLAVIAGIIAHMVVGMLWYSPLLFGPLWMRHLKRNAKEMNMHAGHLVGAALIGFTLTLSLAHFSDVLGVQTCRGAIEYALLLWLGFIATTRFSDVIWQGKPTPVFLIDAGYWAVNLSIISCIVTKI